MNRLTEALAGQCRDHLLVEKWVVAPSLRIGFQWLDAVARSGQPVMNARVKTVRHLALDLAAPEMTRREWKFLTGRRAEVLVDGVLGRLRAAPGGYLSGLRASAGLTATVQRAIHDLRLAGLTAADLRRAEQEARERGRGVFEVPAKAAQMADILHAYEDALAREGLADYPMAVEMAAARVKGDAKALPPGVLVFLPDEEEQVLTRLERALWQALPAACRRTLATDDPNAPAAADEDNLSLLRWLSSPADAPPPREDDSVQIFRAIGEVNEVREVFRRCVEDKTPFDQVEVLHTDSATYVPLLFELATRLMPEGASSPPVTFAEGIPARYFRPGRALTAWVSWVRGGFPQTTLVEMVEDGLLNVADESDHAPGFNRLGAILRALPIGAGDARHLEALDRTLAGVSGELQSHRSVANAEEIEGVRLPKQEELKQHQEGLRRLRGLVGALLADMPGEGASQAAVLRKAKWFVETGARCVNQMDAYARRKLLDEIEDMAKAIGDGDVAGLDVWEWLAELAAEATVGGQGPRPGCIYVASLLAGGHAGRTRTFVLGLDETRFPGAGLQDPLLLDEERRNVSHDLPTAAARLAKTRETFHRLIARLRGRATFSYCCRSLEDDRDLFPSTALLAVYRVLSGEHDGDQEAMRKWLPPPASFAPQTAARAVDAGEWWLWRLCGQAPVRDAPTLIAACFPHLGRGFHAAAERASDRFTEYDGWAPRAGAALDPRHSRKAVSASQLELLGKCPLAYFFKYALHLELPEEFAVEPGVWLDPLQKGSLLHDVFRQFMARMTAADRLPVYERDRDLLQQILAEHVALYERAVPPLNREAHARDLEELRRTARLFLLDEEKFCQASRPRWFEVAIGVRSEGDGTPLDAERPVTLTLPGRTDIVIRGRVDRIDEDPRGGGTRFTVWDYKTGSSHPFEGGGNFNQGRHLQNVFYQWLAEARLREEVSPQARVTCFGYYFPNPREQGKRLWWADDVRDEGAAVVRLLCDMLAQGCFPISDKAEDVEHSDYLAAFGDVPSATAALQRKLANPANAVLEAFRELREVSHD